MEVECCKEEIVLADRSAWVYVHVLSCMHTRTPVFHILEEEFYFHSFSFCLCLCAFTGPEHFRVLNGCSNNRSFVILHLLSLYCIHS